MNYMPVIILDRNVISLIKEANLGKVISDSNKLNMLSQLNELDIPENKISPIFSIIEGQKGRKESFEEKRNTAEIETDELKKFFKKAIIDTYPLDHIGYLYASLDIDRSYLNTKVAIGKFLKRASKLISNPISENKRRSIADNLIELAKECKISSYEGGKFALFLGLLCLYRDNNALKVVKYKKAKKINLYNALNDIFHFINFIKIKAHLANFHSFTAIRFITDDKSLSGLFDYVEDISEKVIDDKKLVAYKLNFYQERIKFLPNDILEIFQKYDT